MTFECLDERGGCDTAGQGVSKSQCGVFTKLRRRATMKMETEETLALTLGEGVPETDS